MRPLVPSALLLFLVAVGASAQEAVLPPGKSNTPPELATTRGKAGYGIGVSVGRQLRVEGLTVDDLRALMMGIADGLQGRDPRLSEQQFQAAMLALQQEKKEQNKAVADGNAEKGKAFLVENSKKPGIQVLPSGLQYQVVAGGKGATPKATDRVRTHYRGTLIDGREFDSSYKRKQPAVFGVNEVIPGWTEALQKMQVGAKWKIFLPSALAYGENGSPPVIGPNSVLIFELELLGIE